MNNFYKHIAVGIVFTGLLSSCAPNRGKAELSVTKDINGARDTLVIHKVKQDITEKYLVLSDTNAIKEQRWDVVLREDNFNGGFFIDGTTRDGKDYFDEHYDTDPGNENKAHSDTYIDGFSWNNNGFEGRAIYLNYIPK